MSRRPPRPPGLWRVLPRRAVSRATGVLARARLPRPLVALAVGVYARAYRVRLDEAVRPAGGWTSFVDFFARRLRPGARPLPDDEGAVACPADGHVGQAGRVTGRTLLQVKGLPYAVDDLVGRPGASEAVEGGSFLQIHLAPSDYHRFHWPFEGTLEEVRHLPGDLWPVHPGALASVPRLFVRNERVALAGRTATGHPFWLVAAGALNVGSIRLEQHPLRTNRGGPARPRRWAVEGVRFARGAPCGWFELGSALVLVLAPGAGHLDALEAGTSLRAGQAVGRLTRRA